MTIERGKKLRRKGGMHASTGVAGAAAYICVAIFGGDLPSSVDMVALTSAVTTIFSVILNEAADPK
tara:strand:+ start:1360 stop:1557 length:198 start_codon:yes stop_codon:yes gene_type:complete